MTRNSGRGGDRTPDAEDVRLIETASAVLSKRGIKGTSTDDIARAAGVTRVTLYRRLGPRDDILRAIYGHETQRLMRTVNARYTPFESLQWDPVKHIEDLLVGTVFDIRQSELLRRFIEDDKVEAMALLAGQSDTVLDPITEMLAQFVRSTWNADVHTRQMDNDECDILSREVASVVGRFLHSLVVMPDGPPVVDTEERIRALARRVLVPMILQR
ncbi:TetR/AcrR family transcriptional regulator [Dietzia sp. ANT_WB102]|uniref:TetR/AcrR family transcriptional regulator n=1 Tax=Dietzia sp. ANT_WB102 TaxID=2597345 RepID=UPI0011EC5E86|nr:TetR/AcrR family transcriptional regulator [Dietzia sp. ANT_WB102]KAA0918598.1 TetR/AcrR family transcriptional regulator [Dietzia sp. ANT_WB102]